MRHTSLPSLLPFLLCRCLLLFGAVAAAAAAVEGQVGQAEGLREEEGEAEPERGREGEREGGRMIGW